MRIVKKYPVIEMADTWQGEGPHAGLAIWLIRFAGCNLTCSWCDQPDARSDYGLAADRRLSISGLEVQLPSKYRHILLTGGEPTLYIDDSLVRVLSKYQKQFVTSEPPKILIETNGVKPRSSAIQALLNHHTVISPKAGFPVRYMEDPGRYHLKYVVPGDWESPEGIARQVLDFGADPSRVYFQPQWPIEWNAMKGVKRCAEIYEEITGYRPRLSIQGHKYVNNP